jgi:hypothetical protein
MSHYEHSGDGTMTRELRDSLAELAVPRQPPLAAITSRGRAHRRRRARFAWAGLAGAAASIALVLGLTGVLGAASRSTGTIQDGAFSVTSHTDGTVSVKLGLLFDPAALQRALAQDHVPALVRNDIFCASSPSVPNSAIAAVLPGAATLWRHSAATQHPSGVPQLLVDFNGILMSGTFPVKPRQLAPSVDPVTIVIKPAALPAGTELYIGYFNLGHTVLVSLIYTKSHDCVHRQLMPDAP